MPTIGGLGWPTVGAGTGWVIAVLGVIWIFRGFMRGDLVSRRQHERELTSKDEEIERLVHEKNEWRAEGRIKDQQLQVQGEEIAEKNRQLSHLGEVGRTTIATLDAVRALALGQTRREDP